MPIKIKKSIVPSPCIRICQYDENFVCIGCGRTAEEISGWMRMTDEKRKEVMERVKNYSTED